MSSTIFGSPAPAGTPHTKTLEFTANIDFDPGQETLQAAVSFDESGKVTKVTLSEVTENGDLLQIDTGTQSAAFPVQNFQNTGADGTVTVYGQAERVYVRLDETNSKKRQILHSEPAPRPMMSSGGRTAPDPAPVRPALPEHPADVPAWYHPELRGENKGRKN